MFKSKALALTVSKTAFAFFPILLAPICLGASVVLIDFYRLQLGLSIGAAVGSLGLGTYVYALAAHPYWSHTDRQDLTCLILLLKAASTLLFLVGIICATVFYLYYHSSFYFKYVLLIPFSYFFVEQQIRLAKQHYFQAFVSFVVPPLVFSLILVVTCALSGSYFDEVCWVILGAVDLLILWMIRFGNFKKKFGLRWRRIKQYLLKSKIASQICNGIIAYVCPPIVTLVIIDWLERLQFNSQIIAAYYLYTRAIDSLISLLITYFAAGYMQEMMQLKKIKFTSKKIIFYGSMACIFYASINYVVNYLVHYMNFLMAGLEVGIGTLKFFLAIFTLLAIKKFPKIIGIKEVFILSIIFLLGLFYTPANIYYFQISIFLSFLSVLCALAVLIRSLQSSPIAWLK